MNPPDDDSLAKKFALILPLLNERQQRLFLAAEAKSLGYGGVSRVARTSGVSRSTITRGLVELSLAIDAEKPARIRRSGGGRKPIENVYPGIGAALDALIHPSSRGDPQSPLRWTCKSTHQLAKALKQQGYSVSHQTVAQLLHTSGYSLQANAKVKEGRQHPDRNQQFEYINEQAKSFLAQGLPVVSVDAKKKELIGEFKNSGQTWELKKQPVEVDVHDFVNPQLGKAIPYGIYDVGENSGWVSVGCNHDTASFAVATLERWWQAVGQQTYPDATALLVNADSGGSNGYRVRLWKYELQQFANKTGLTITVCHLPPGTSKWNKIEHRLFSHISMNWRGQPLTSHEVVVQLICATKATTGLEIRAELDRSMYPIQVKVLDEDFSTIHITPHSFHGEWNYTITPSSN